MTLRAVAALVLALRHGRLNCFSQAHTGAASHSGYSCARLAFSTAVKLLLAATVAVLRL